MLDRILPAASKLVEIRESIVFMPGNVDPCDEMIDSLGDMCRHLLLALPGSTVRKFGIETIGVSVFIKSFINIAGYSCHLGRSSKLIRMILHALSADIIRLCRKLRKRLRVMKQSTQSTHEVTYIY